jgi:hypothetical protein
MICRFDNLRRYPTVFLKMTGLRLNEFAELLDDLLPRFAQAEQARLQPSYRRRAKGGGRHPDLAPRDQILLAVIWLRQYPTNEVLAFLFDVSDSTVSPLVNRLVPLLEASGKDTMRMPDPGRKHRKELDTLLKQTPELAVIIDTFEQKVQRCKHPKQADAHFSGKKQQHTLKPQVAVDEQDGTVCDVAESVVGPTADVTVLKQSGLLWRLPDRVGAPGDLAYIGIAEAHPQGLGATPRRKPGAKERPEEDVCFNPYCGQRRRQ